MKRQDRLNDISQYMMLVSGQADKVVADAKEVYRQQRNFWALLATSDDEFNDEENER